MSITLSYVTFTIAAGTETANNLGGALAWKFDGNQARRVVITSAHASDSFLIEGTLDGSTWFNAAAAQTGATSYVVSLTGPYNRLRITKTGTNASAVVQAIV
jgi:hypothetical protein